MAKRRTKALTQKVAEAPKRRTTKPVGKAKVDKLSTLSDSKIVEQSASVDAKRLAKHVETAASVASDMLRWFDGKKTQQAAAIVPVCKSAIDTAGMMRILQSRKHAGDSLRLARLAFDLGVSHGTVIAGSFGAYKKICDSFTARKASEDKATAKWEWLLQKYGEYIKPFPEATKWSRKKFGEHFIVEYRLDYEREFGEPMDMSPANLARELRKRANS